MNNVYILRSKPDGVNRENEFLSGRISVGWPCGESFSGKNRAEISSILVRKYPDISKTSVSMVESFVEMPKCSIVLTPSLQDKSLIHVLRTMCSYKYDKTFESKGNPHFIEAEYLKTVARKSLPNDVVKSLSGARKTLSKISQHFDLLNDFIESDFKAVKEVSPVTVGKKTEAIRVLEELLSSGNEDIRLKAAITIIGLD